MPSKVHNSFVRSDTNIYLQLVAAVHRAGIKPESVEEVFMGNVLSAK